MASFTLAFADKKVVDSFLGVIRQGIIEEANYELEAANLKKFGRILSQHSEVDVSSMIDEYSTQTVLTLDFLEGQKLDEALDAMVSQEEKDRVGFVFSEI